MSKTTTLLTISALLAGLLYTGCTIATRQRTSIKYASAPMDSHGSFRIRTLTGRIKVEGTETDQLHLSAKVTGLSRLEHNAVSLARNTTIRLYPADGEVAGVVERAVTAFDEAIIVDLDIYPPIATSLELSTRKGSINISDITGDINAVTIEGPITVSRFRGNLDLKTDNGHIDVTYLPDADGLLHITAVTKDGDITITLPPEISAHVLATTSNGQITNNLNLPVTEQFGQRKIEGMAGTAQGRIFLYSKNGSITIQ